MNKEIELKILSEEIKSFKQLLGYLPNNIYKNLHEYLGISKTMLTQLIKNPKEKGTLDIAKDISRLLEIDPIVLIMGLEFGYPNITLEEMDELGYQFQFGFNKAS